MTGRIGLRATLLVAAFSALLVGCGPSSAGRATPSTASVGTTGAGVSMTPAPNLTDSNQVSPAGLVAPRHARCDIGVKLLHYLATGDNGGDPYYDQTFANDVGASPPQARAIADKAIQDCDAAADKLATSQAQAATATREQQSEAAAATSKEQAASVLQQQRIESCRSIKGSFQPGYELCTSTVQGTSSGAYPSDCSYAMVGYEGGSQISQTQLAQSKKSYPGCWPG